MNRAFEYIYRADEYKFFAGNPVQMRNQLFNDFFVMGRLLVGQPFFGGSSAAIDGVIWLSADLIGIGATKVVPESTLTTECLAYNTGVSDQGIFIHGL